MLESHNSWAGRDLKRAGLSPTKTIPLNGLPNLLLKTSNNLYEQPVPMLHYLYSEKVFL